jgi:hypothetical protein
MAKHSLLKFEYFSLMSLKVFVVAVLTFLTQAISVRLTQAKTGLYYDSLEFVAKVTAGYGLVLVVSFSLVLLTSRSNSGFAKWLWIFFWIFIFLPCMFAIAVDPIRWFLSFLLGLSAPSATMSIVGGIGIGLLFIGLSLQLVAFCWLLFLKNYSRTV